MHRCSFGQRSSSSKVALCSAPGGFGDVWDTQSVRTVRCACIFVGSNGSLESLESLESFRSDMNFLEDLEGLDSTGSQRAVKAMTEKPWLSWLHGCRSLRLRLHHPFWALQNRARMSEELREAGRWAFCMAWQKRINALGG